MHVVGKNAWDVGHAGQAFASQRTQYCPAFFGVLRAGLSDQAHMPPLIMCFGNMFNILEMC